MEFCNESVANLDWVAEQGVPIQDVEAIHSSLTPWRVHNVEGGGGMTNGHGGQIIVPLLDKFLSLGGEIIYNTAADELLVDENGLVSGLHALKSDGSNVTVNAQATILATGGFFQNKELMSRYPAAVNANTSAPKGNVGDSLKMAEKVGADVFMSNGVHIVFCNFAGGVGICKLYHGLHYGYGGRLIACTVFKAAYDSSRLSFYGDCGNCHRYFTQALRRLVY